MRRLLKIVGLLIIILFGSFFLLRYVLFPVAPVGHIYEAIPDAADYVILVDTEELLSLSFSEFLSNPIEGNPFDDDEEADDSESDYNLKDILSKGLWHGLEVPEQLIVYRSDEANAPFVVLLPLSDSEEFEAFLLDSRDRIGLTQQAPGRWADSSLTIDIAKEYMRLCFGKAIPIGTNKVASKSWATLLSPTEPGAVIRFFIKENNGMGGKAELFSESGRLRLVFESETELPFNAGAESALSKGWLSIQVGPEKDTRSQLLQSKSLLSSSMRKAGLDPIAIDSIWNGSFELCVQGLSAAQEEIVSYSYNDDFEKVEQREIKESIEADFSAVIGLTKPSDSLFYRKSWVKRIDGRDLFVNYPIQEVYYQEQEGRIMLGSSLNNLKACQDSPAELSFLSLDIAGLEADWNANLEVDFQFVSGMKTIRAEHSTDRESISIQLTFQDERRQGLFSLLEFPNSDLIP